MRPVTIDFETHAIGPRPEYPPKPVGVAIMWHGRKPKYMAWGHPTGNNCTRGEAASELAKVWAYPGGVLMHNAKFDLEVAQKEFGLGIPHHDLFHDTLLLAYLSDPHAKSFGLKQLAEDLLKMPPTERDEVRQWIKDAGLCSTLQWGAFIAQAPGDLVGKYAIGDVERTAQLYDVLIKDVLGRGMGEAYDREKKLIPILMRMEQRGIHVTSSLEPDLAKYTAVHKQVDEWIRKRLKAPLLSVDKDVELIDALVRARKVDLQRLGVTKTGEYRTDKLALANALTDDTLNGMLRYRGALSTALRTFMMPWHAAAQASGGRVFVGWNQTRTFERGKPQGTVTGRLSSSPNFQNVPKEFPPIFRHENNDRSLPKCPIELPPLPLVRNYLGPNSDKHVLIDRDYSQQELRILGHFEDGSLKKAYCDDPWLDIHDHAKALIDAAMHCDMPRSYVKTTGFGMLYGMGIARLAASLKIDAQDARALKQAYLNAFPGLRDLQAGLRELAQENKPLRTWGGRRYFCERPQIINGEVRTFEYKMLNVLIQGSAADCTKEAVIRYEETKPKGHHLLLTVHDELLVSCPASEAKKGHEALRRAMESVEFSVPMKTDGSIGLSSWGRMKKFDKKGVLV